MITITAIKPYFSTGVLGKFSRCLFVPFGVPKLCLFVASKAPLKTGFAFFLSAKPVSSLFRLAARHYFLFFLKERRPFPRVKIRSPVKKKSDSDYRNEVKILLINLSKEPFTVKSGDRIAQIIFAPTFRITWLPVEELNETKRGMGGFGSTGV
ncbi:deoxyuridine 5'-triphosphate nucleotidohydrolase [Brazilian marseillevirus]|uniref:deoxyuridine 5'-triphosphate nucleotidohydrolase n=1 Tax=Brazilian marseillevirus TaxID=1813599 RepID=UPI00078070E2|nr:deoxyuridine 5'-triphosphate nucleotidohydrolase [Brazilian marseillevirus]AMQ10577.1 deoxyuridine 5'-triphosphate nucleotidohydrolase [Brazilian marseillevirus]